MPSIKTYITISILCIIGGFNNGFGQNELSNFHQIRLSSLHDTIVYTNGPIIVSSVNINPVNCHDEKGLIISQNSIHFSPNHAYKVENDSVFLSYRLFPNVIMQKYCLIDSNQIEFNDRE